MKRVIFHIDVNSAYLSWEAVHRLQRGEKRDLRDIPAVVGGNPERRHGIVLAKSLSAKKYGIQTGESLMEAFKKCPILTVVPPTYGLYVKCSEAMVDVIKRFSPEIERYSIDECFVDYTEAQALFGEPVATAYKIQQTIYRELGFTVSIGVSTNKLLAKMASELKKPNGVSTLYPGEVPQKLWPLPVSELFMVGRATFKKLKQMGVLTIGDLSALEPAYLKSKLKSHGVLIWQYANGIDLSPVQKNGHIPEKSIGNSTTTGYDVDRVEEAELVLLSLCESVGARLREKGMRAQVVQVHVKNHLFETRSKQIKVKHPIESTLTLFNEARALLKALWDGTPLRHLGVATSALTRDDFVQYDLFEGAKRDKRLKLDATLDALRTKYSKDVLVRGCLLNSGVPAVSGGVGEDEFIMMGSVL